MEPRLLLQWLMDKAELNSSSLAAKLEGATTQPQIHKFLSGKAKEPRRSTLLPVADYFKIPIDALYSPDVADTVKNKLGINQALAPVDREQSATNNIAPSLAQSIEVLSQYLIDMDATTRRRAGRLLADLADEPQTHAQITQMLEAAIRSGKADATGPAEEEKKFHYTSRHPIERSADRRTQKRREG